MSKSYAVASGKGGVGKSVITANLAAALSQNGARVIIVDADIGLRSQDALLSLENRVVYDLIDLVNGECLADQAILSCEAVPGLHLLPAAQFERVKTLDPKKFGKILRVLCSAYDYVFVDCPAGIERGLRNVLNAGVDEIILTVTPDDISVRSAERAAQIISGKQGPRPAVIVNRYDAGLVRSGDMMSAGTVSQVLDLPLLGVVPEDSAVYRSVLKHDLFARYNCDAGNAVRRIASRIAGRNTPIPGFNRTGKSPFLRFFRRSVKEVSPIDDL